MKKTPCTHSPSKIRARRENLSALFCDEIPTRDESASSKTHNRRASTGSPVPYRYDSKKSVSPVRFDGSSKTPSRSSFKDKHIQVFRNKSEEECIVNSTNFLSKQTLPRDLASPFIPRHSLRSSSFDSCSESLSVVSRNIYNLWHNQQLCDVKIQAGGRQFLAHKLVMAASCGIFAKEIEERSTPISLGLEIVDVSADAMNDVLKYFYTHRLHISGHNVDSLMKIAHDLEIKVITEKCKEYLKDVCWKNVVQNRYIAQKFGLSDIVAHIDMYFKDNFQELSTTCSFLQSDFQQVYDIVSSDVITPGSELELFHACASWIDFHRQERLKYVVPLMALIRFVQIPADKLVSDVEIAQHIFEIPECKDMLYNAFKQHALMKQYIGPAIIGRDSAVQQQKSRCLSSQSMPIKERSSSGERQSSGQSRQTSQPCLLRPHSSHSVRSTRDELSISRSSSSADEKTLTDHDLPSPPATQSVLVIGGMNNFDFEATSEILHMVQQYEPMENSWTGRTELPLPLHHCGVASLDGYLYVMGGMVNDSLHGVMEVTASCHRYDVAKNEWSQVARMLTPRAEFAAVVLNNVIYTVGGVDNKMHSLSTMEFYNVEEDIWRYTSAMNEPRVGLAAAAHRGHVFVVGGMIGRPNADRYLLDSVEAYNPSTNLWKLKAEFPLHVCHASLIDVNDVLYLVGGYVTRDGDSILSLNNIFRYQDDTDAWEAFTTLHVPRHDSTVVALDSRIYVIGGTSSATVGVALSNVECIDVETKERIEGIAPLPTPAYGLRGCADSWDFDQRKPEFE